MAETAPLTSAHNHARKAAEIQHLQFSEAAEEHQQASAEFARAAKSTGNAEALRVLRLLEEQHQRLARIVRTQDDIQEPPEVQTATDQPRLSSPQNRNDETALKTSSDKATRKTKSPSGVLASTRVGSQTRDASPSLARDIASRRGIPQPVRTQPSPAAQARARQLSPESRRKARTANAPDAPPSIVDSQASLQATRRTAKKTEEDEGFTKFYSNLTSGTMSKLSSVLAFAGLPLTADDVQSEQGAKPRNEKRTVSASNDPDVKKIFSRAALDAIEDEHRQRGTLGHGFGPAESFYVVQTGGGTYSYADIAKAQQQQLSGIDEDEEAEFVDAKEVPAASSSRAGRSLDQRRASFGNSRTHEELELENTTLKQTLEQIAGRLAAFESHAQEASMAALTQSMANFTTTGHPASQGTPDAAVMERMSQLEKQIEQQAEERQRLESLNGKQEKMLKKYQSKWEEIKKSAREKEKAKKEKAEKMGGEGAGEISEAG